MDFDVAVVGAGPAGCMVALRLARYGHRVGLFDVSDRQDLGNTVIVEVERDAFAKVGLSTPRGDEVAYHCEQVHVVSPRRRVAFTLPDGMPTVAIYLDRFVKELLSEAEREGVRFFGQYRAEKVVSSSGAINGVVFTHRDSEHIVTAKLVIDATGFAATLVRSLDGSWEMTGIGDIADEVIAANYLHEIDPDRAQAAVNSGVHGDDELRAGVGQFGRFSTEFSYLSIAARQAYVLIGIKADYDGLPIEKLVDQFKKRQSYYGNCRYGGQGKIRIRHALERLVADGFMAIGEAGCMVNPLLGSGVTTALFAGCGAAEVVSEALFTGRVTTARLWPFAADYQRRRGAVFAGYDVVRLSTERLNSRQAITMVEGGLSQPADVVATNTAHPLFSPSWASVRRAAILYKHPDLIMPLGKMAALYAAVYQHHRRYPRHYDPQTFAAWKKWSHRLFATLR